ncbi:acrylyl-CoA reductase (NADPH) [Limimonas halophila]|uniref:Acrylyl-CoA reductase (NADPH) n=1 Tax=Limimonas halophila TaxID=1082479 RepID=A0A1G7LD47_9PROT|nr:MDR family oxidoreductase [Limimonas halophila]SDF47492.1 acrylyl-CoA reductase (NADPH) [Limimonas halophila]
MVRALVLDDGDQPRFAELSEDDLKDRLPDGEVTVRVEASTLNYKDGMVVKGLGKLVKQYPHVPGIDFAGEVVDSQHPGYSPGDRVICTGWGVGERYWGGFADTARVKGDWLVPLPENLTPWRAMALGTAGLTAMLAVMKLEDHGMHPDQAEPVLVTGAAGGVGSIATSVLSGLGYEVAALTGRAEVHDYLRGLGASQIVDRSELAEGKAKPLETQRWGACVDAVGGSILARVLSQLVYGGSVASVGLAGGAELNTTVMPFLLRGVNLLGIDSVMCPYARRVTAWKRLSHEMSMRTLDELSHEIGLSEVPEEAGRILQGQVRGRTVIDPTR